MGETKGFLKLLKSECVKGRRLIPIPHDYAMSLLSYIEQLENNRDKALKIIDSYELGKYDYSIPPGGIIELRDVLRGDSDE